MSKTWECGVPSAYGCPIWTPDGDEVVFSDINRAIEVVRACNARADMLAVLQQLRRPIQYDINVGKGLFSDADLKALDAAIAKATGAA